MLVGVRNIDAVIPKVFLDANIFFGVVFLGAVTGYWFRWFGIPFAKSNKQE